MSARKLLWAIAFSALFATPVAAKVTVAPHRATYSMELLSARNGSPVIGASGTMEFEWRDACDAWTIDQNFALRFLYNEGEQVEMTTNFTSWEAKDGLRYRFNVRKTTNGAVDELLSGDANLKGEGQEGTVRFAEPEQKDISLKSGTMFPTAHTIALLEQAQQGSAMFSKSVFDGSENEGPIEISAFIHKSRKPEPPEGVESSLLKVRRAWPMRMAFYPASENAELPDYEVNVNLLENGIWDSMVFDYGDFQIKAVLKSIEDVKKPKC